MLGGEKGGGEKREEDDEPKKIDDAVLVLNTFLETAYDVAGAVGGPRRPTLPPVPSLPSCPRSSLPTPTPPLGDRDRLALQGLRERALSLPASHPDQ